MGHHRFLSRNHKFRLNRVRFDGSIEERNPPLKLSGSDIFRQVEHINTTFGTGAIQNGTRKRSRQEVTQWNKRSIFFELPYWESNLLRHNLDFMHIEKMYATMSCIHCSMRRINQKTTLMLEKT